MSSTQASTADDREFPRLNGRNFIIWKTRVTAALEGKNLLGYVERIDYTGDSDYEFDSDEELNPALSDMNDMSAALDAAGAPKADEIVGSSPSESSSDASSASSDAPTAGDDGDVEMGQENPPVIQSFTAQKRDELKRAEKLKAKSQRLSSKKLRLNEAKAKAFLIKTIDDQHVLMVKDKTTAFEIFQTICSKYEGAAIHGDPYHVLSYLMALRYEEGSDLTGFIIDIESAMKVASEATNSVLSDEQKSLYLYHALPGKWKQQLSVWKGSRKFIPYEELKRHIEAKVQHELAKNRYTLKQGTPESRETRNEQALQALAPEPTLVQAPYQESKALISTMSCTYCLRTNHDTVDCYVLQRHLQNGQVKAGTVLPANFKLKPSSNQARQHPYKDGFGGKSRSQNRNDYKSKRNSNRNRSQNGNQKNTSEKSKSHNKFHGRRKDTDSDNEYGIIAITTLDLRQETEAVSLTAQDAEHDPVWTVDSGCTRHVTSNPKWFEKLIPSAGKSITVGGNHQIPIKGTGDVKMTIKDTKGKEREISLANVLYAPQLKFNLLSVRQAVEDDFKINFPNAKKCVLFFASRTKFEAKIGEGTRLYQFQASPATSSQVAHVATSGKPDNVLLWHKRMGHPNFRIMQDLAKANTVMDMGLKDFDSKKDYFCSSCTYAKAHRNPFNKRTVERAKFPLEKVHSDMAGPLPVPTLSGCQYFLTFIDDYSRYMFIYIIKRKSELYECYEDFRKKAQNVFRADVGELQFNENIHDEEVRHLQSDNAREYEKLGKMIFQKYNTHAQFTNAYTPQQNGVAERRMRTLLERTRAFLIDGNLPQVLWGECVKHVADLLNITPSSVTDKVTPYEKWFKRKPSAHYIKVFGCTAYAHIPEIHRTKLEPRAKKCMYLGLPSNKKGYRLLDTKENRVIYSRDVVFREDEFPHLEFLNTPAISDQNGPAPTLSPSLPTPQLLPPIASLLKRSVNALAAEVVVKMKKVKHKTNAQNEDEHSCLLDDPLDINERKEHLTHIYALLAIRHISEPKTFLESQKLPEAQHWEKAAICEYKSLIDNKTWVLTKLPTGRRALQCRWVFVVKYNGDGSIDRYKARLVIKGFLQKYGVDYDEIFSPVIRMEVLRLLLTIAALLDLEIHQMDVKTAFLNGYLDEEIYMLQPEGFTVRGKEHLVCKLLKSLYGLKQAPRIWYLTLCSFLLTMKFHKLIKDQCVFIGVVDGATCYILVYVDDLLIIAPTLDIINNIKNALKQRFKMSDLGEAQYILGWSIVRNRTDRTIFIHQEKYATKVLDRFSHLDAHPVGTPADPSVKLTEAMCPQTPEEKHEMKAIPYREAVGSFMYLMMGTRPDLAYFLREVSQFLVNPGKPHWNAVKRGLKYLNGTRNLGITLGGKQNLEQYKSKHYLTAYSDADYANCPETRRSVGGYIAYMCGSPISWQSRKHHTVVLSTTEAEYIALCHCMQEVIFLKLLLVELKHESSHAITLFEDNQSCIKLSYNPELHGRSKHIDIRYHFVQEKVERKEFEIMYCNTKEMVADIFSKALSKPFL